MREPNMEPLVIEYVFEGHQRGYNFTSSTRAYDDFTLKTIWRGAMPRGQGWGAAAYTGAHALKCFAVDEDSVAIARTTVTDLQDENGRKGIRRTEVDIMPAAVYRDHLRARLDAHPAPIRDQAQAQLTFWKRASIIEKTLPKFRRDPQLILTAPYTETTWQVIEALALRLALEPIGLMRRWLPVIPLTTLALDYQEESRIVAVPAEKAVAFPVPVVRLHPEL